MYSATPHNMAELETSEQFPRNQPEIALVQRFLNERQIESQVRFPDEDDPDGDRIAGLVVDLIDEGGKFKQFEGLV